MQATAFALISRLIPIRQMRIFCWAMRYFARKRPLESLAEFTAGARFRRPKADELMTVASDYVMLGDFADADKWFTEVTVETPNNPDAWYLLGRTKYNENAFRCGSIEFRACAWRCVRNTLRPKIIWAWCCAN